MSASDGKGQRHGRVRAFSGPVFPTSRDPIWRLVGRAWKFPWMFSNGRPNGIG